MPALPQRTTITGNPQSAEHLSDHNELHRLHTELETAAVVTNLEIHRADLDAHEGRLDIHDGRLDTDTARLDTHEGRLNTHDGRLDTDTSRLDTHEGRLNTHDGQFTTHDGRLDAHDGQFTIHDGRLNTHDGRLDTHEIRINELDVTVDVATNGTGNQTPVIQAAIDAANTAGGGVVRIPTGTVNCQASLVARSNVTLYLSEGTHLRKDFAVGTGLTGAFIQNPDYTSRISKFRILGPGRMGARDTTMTGIIVGLYGDDMRFQDFTVDTYGGGQAFLIAGDRMRLRDLQVINPIAAIGNGGIRYCGGNDFIAYGCHVESGDDSLQFVPIANSTSELFNQPISRGAYIGCTGRSTNGRFMAVIFEGDAMTASINNVSFIGCHGRGGFRGVLVYNDDSSGAIDGVSFTDCSIDQAGATTSSGHGEIDIRSSSTGGPVRNVFLKRVAVRNPTRRPIKVGVQGGTSVTTVKVEDCNFPAPSNAEMTFDVIGATDVAVRDCTVQSAAASDGMVLGTVNGVTDVIVEGCRFTDIPDSQRGIDCLNVTNGRFRDNTFIQAGTLGRGMRISSTSSAVLIEGNDVTQLGTIKFSDSAPDTRYRANRGAGVTSIVSAATITLNGGEFFNITGATGITNITATGNNGRTVTLKFAGALTVTDGGNLSLNGDFTTSADDTLTLVCDGTNWYEVSRSAN